MSYYLKRAAHNVYIVGSSPNRGKAQRREGDVAGCRKTLTEIEILFVFHLTTSSNILTFMVHIPIALHLAPPT